MFAMKALAGAAVLALLSGAAPPPPVPELGETPAYSGLFRVGDTGIDCYKEPCPRRGIIPVDAQQPRRWRPIWSGETPPPLRGSKADRRRITSSWADDGCLLVEGAFMDGTLHVQQIQGAC